MKRSFRHKQKRLAPQKAKSSRELGRSQMARRRTSEKTQLSVSSSATGLVFLIAASAYSRVCSNRLSFSLIRAAKRTHTHMCAPADTSGRVGQRYGRSGNEIRGSFL